MRYSIVEDLQSYLEVPLGILLVNVIASFLLGLMPGLEANKAFILIGFLEAHTTWSSLLINLEKMWALEREGVWQ